MSTQSLTPHELEERLDLAHELLAEHAEDIAKKEEVVVGAADILVTSIVTRPA